MRQSYKVCSDRPRSKMQGDINYIIISASDETIAKQITYENHFVATDKDYMKTQTINIEKQALIAIDRI